jgi:asparagine synthase (glutamine-hydrolysing)
MCGITGIIGTQSGKQELIQKMNDSLIHRGPDGSGIYISESENVAFGHRRLSIIELSKLGAQPMHFIERYTITFNGEIYNYLELQKEIKKSNISLSTATDTEVILALFHLHKEKCLDYFDGMFSFAIYDRIENITFVARDRFGEKPFYYTKVKESIYFASEMKALWAIGIPKIPNKAKVSDYLLYNDIDSINTLNDTYYKGIYSLPPATFSYIRNGEIIETKKYWSIDLSNINKKISFTEAKLEFKRLLNESILLRMRSDVSLGSSLSGGIDSTIIVSQINKNLKQGQDQRTFSARFKNFEKDEGYYIDLVLKGLNRTIGHNTFPDGESFKKDLDKLIFHQEEPFRTASQYNQFEVMKLAAENNVVVLLDGQGADEYLGGYLEYYFHYLTNMVYTKPRSAFKEIQKYNKIQKGHRDYRVPRRLPLWLIQKQFGKKLIFDEDVREKMLKDSTQLHLQTLLRYGDKNSMAFSREVRLPFLSHKLVEFVFSLPTEFILNSGWTKCILRESYNNEIPKEIAWRVDKVGFEPPQKSWMPLFNDEIINAKKEIDLGQFELEANLDVSDWKWLMLNRFFN